MKVDDLTMLIEQMKVKKPITHIDLKKQEYYNLETEQEF